MARGTAPGGGVPIQAGNREQGQEKRRASVPLRASVLEKCKGTPYRNAPCFGLKGQRRCFGPVPVRVKVWVASGVIPLAAVIIRT